MYRINKELVGNTSRLKLRRQVNIVAHDMIDTYQTDTFP